MSTGRELCATTDLGVRVERDDATLRAGPSGPTLGFDDFILRQKIFHFDHERIPERVVHARGSGAYGTFTCTRSMQKFTRAAFLGAEGKKTEVFVRFSQALGRIGSPDTSRDARGFAVKFYTEQGNYDLVGNNFPIFIIRDGIKFPDFAHALRPESDSEIPVRNFFRSRPMALMNLIEIRTTRAPTARFGSARKYNGLSHSLALTHTLSPKSWVASSPETHHHVLFQMSDRGIPRSYRMMEGFSINTFRFTGGDDAEHESWLVRFHAKPRLGVHGLVWDEAQELRGRDPDFLRRDLWEAIAAGNMPQWELGVQLLPDDLGDAEKRAAAIEMLGFDPLDPTKFWPEELVPVQMFGTLELNRNVSDFHAETEQAAFCPGNLVPGIELSDDPVLQVRAFSYLDTQLKRLGGPNFNQIPINRAKHAIVSHNQRGGHMQMDVAPGRVSYNPSMLSRDPAVAETSAPPYHHVPALVHGQRVRVPFQETGRLGSDEHAQARVFFLSLAPWERVHIMEAFCYELSQVAEREIRLAIVNDFLGEIDTNLATGVARFLGLPPPSKVPPPLPPGVSLSPALSLANTPKTAATRKVAVLVADGFDVESTTGVLDLLSHEGGQPVFVSCMGAAPVSSSAGKLEIKSPLALSSVSSTMFDAVFVAEGVEQVRSAAVEILAFILQAYRHFKAIGFASSTAAALAPPGTKGQQGVVVLGEQKDGANAFVQAVETSRHWQRQLSPVQEP